tara:strand:- start:100 stop:270 length:171 start_codon:yes stop_codon:yes gene_type:complete
MNNQLPDKTVIIAIIVTILLIFAIAFSFRTEERYLDPSIEWKETPSQVPISIKETI